MNNKTNKIENKQNYTEDFITILRGFNEIQRYVFASIQAKDKIELATHGANDVEGFQIFTPPEIVSQMVKAVGQDALDFSKTILEPTSGDGAFTVYILEKRLAKIKNDYELLTLKALSTIYSIEMDKDLIDAQRNNIFTVIKNFYTNKKLQPDPSFFWIVKCLITTNFIWAKFNSGDSETVKKKKKKKTEQDCDLFAACGVEISSPEDENKSVLAYDMETDEPIKTVPVWEIFEDSITLKYEPLEIK